MSLYNYSAKDMYGNNIKNQEEAVNEAELMETLHDRGLVVISISESRGGKDKYKIKKKKISNLSIFKEKVKLSEMVAFSSQLSAMIGAGIHLLSALDGLSKEMRNQTLKDALEQTRRDIKEGSAFHSALAKHPKVFATIFVHLVRAGEVSGNLDVILNQYSGYLQRTSQLRGKVRAAVTYPIFILSFAMLMVIGMVWKLVPMFQKTYEEFGVDLPLPTRMLVSMSDGIRNHTFLFLLISIGIILLVRSFGRSGKGRIWIDNFKLNMPVFGLLLKYATMSRFARTLGILIGSGLPILECLEIVGRVSGNTVIEKALFNSRLAIQQGSGVAEALRASGAFPEIIIQMVDTGERTGKLDSLLLKSAEFYDQQAEETASILTSLLEPVLIIFLGAIVGFILISIFLPIFMLGKAFMN